VLARVFALLPGVTVAPIDCPRCGERVALLARRSGRLHRPTPVGTPGAVLSSKRRGQAEITCPRCGYRCTTSASGAARRMSRGQHPCA
jgi:DNA-directed RNA polymerase subunit RPC12/RpoP